MRRTLTSTVLLATLLTLAPAASALYVVTPLRAHADTNTAQVGDTLLVTIEPENETTAAQWAGKTVHAYYSYDKTESTEQPEGQTSSEAYERKLIRDDVALDGDTKATFSWTVTADADDHNVAIRIESAEGELLAIADVAVGNAPPVMRALAGSEGGAPEPVQTDMGEEDGNLDDTAGSDNDVPATGALAALAVVGLAAVALRRRIS